MSHKTWVAWLPVMNVSVMVDIVAFTGFSSLDKLALRIQETMFGGDSDLGRLLAQYKTDSLSS